MRIIVCGGRTFGDRGWLFDALDGIHADSRVTLVIEGGASGADGLAREWATENEIPVLTVPAQWKKLGKSAGPARNKQMISMKPSLVLACPGGHGTRDCCRQATDAGLLVMHLLPSQPPQEPSDAQPRHAR